MVKHAIRAGRIAVRSKYRHERGGGVFFTFFSRKILVIQRQTMMPLFTKNCSTRVRGGDKSVLHFSRFPFTPKVPNDDVNPNENDNIVKKKQQLASPHLRGPPLYPPHHPLRSRFAEHSHVAQRASMIKINQNTARKGR